MRTLLSFAFPLILVLLSPMAEGQSAPGPGHASPSLCEVLKSPKLWDGKQLTLNGSVTLEFENFTIYDSKCHTWPGIWLMFGGDVPTPTKSTWNDTERPEGKDIKVNGIAYTIVKDAQLAEFRSAITARSGRKPLYRVTATLSGTFLAERASRDLPNFPGYGHMGCCYLFVIRQVLSVEKKPRADESEMRHEKNLKGTN